MLNQVTTTRTPEIIDNVSEKFFLDDIKSYQEAGSFRSFMKDGSEISATLVTTKKGLNLISLGFSTLGDMPRSINVEDLEALMARHHIAYFLPTAETVAVKNIVELPVKKFTKKVSTSIGAGKTGLRNIPRQSTGIEILQILQGNPDYWLTRTYPTQLDGITYGFSLRKKKDESLSIEVKTSTNGRNREITSRDLSFEDFLTEFEVLEFYRKTAGTEALLKKLKPPTRKKAEEAQSEFKNARKKILKRTLSPDESAHLAKLETAAKSRSTLRIKTATYKSEQNYCKDIAKALKNDLYLSEAKALTQRIIDSIQNNNASPDYRVELGYANRSTAPRGSSYDKMLASMKQAINIKFSISTGHINLDDARIGQIASALLVEDENLKEKFPIVQIVVCFRDYQRRRHSSSKTFTLAHFVDGEDQLSTSN